MDGKRRTIKGGKGHYEFLCSLGRDDLTESYLAVNQDTRGDARWVLVRETLPGMAGNSELADRFLKELRVTSRFRHANLTRMLETGRSKGSIFAITEFLLGDGLGRLLQEARRAGRRLPPALVAGLVIQACDGLDAAHHLTDAKGHALEPLHHNLQPNAIVALYSGQVKLVDFDIARSAFQIRSGFPQSDVAYAPPEQCERQPLGKTSDVFSMGVVLWELLAERPLFKANSYLDTLRAVQATRVPPIGAPDRVPGELEAIAVRALQRNPKSRFSSAADMAQALQDWLKTSGQEAGEFEIGNFARKVCADRERDKRALLTRALAADLGEDEAARLGPDTRMPLDWSEPPAPSEPPGVPAPATRPPRTERLSEAALAASLRQAGAQPDKPGSRNEVPPLPPRPLLQAAPDEAETEEPQIDKLQPAEKPEPDPPLEQLDPLPPEPPAQVQQPAADRSEPPQPRPVIRIHGPDSARRRPVRWQLWLGLFAGLLGATVAISLAWPTAEPPDPPVGAPTPPEQPPEPDQPPPDQTQPAQPKPTPAAMQQAMLDIQSSPTGCSVWLDQRKLPGPTPLLGIQVDPAREHQVVVKCPGRKRNTRKVSPAAGERLALVFRPEPTPPPSHGTLQFNSMPWTEVYLGKRKLGVTPLLGVKLSAGKRSLRLVNPGAGIDKTIQVTIQVGQTTSLLKKF